MVERFHIGSERSQVHIGSERLQAQLRAARYKLHQWQPVLSTPRHVLLVKLQALRTYVMPCVQYAMEIITPRAPDELAIVSEMDVFLEKALLLAVGVPVGLDSWRTRRCVKAAVVWHDLGVLRTMSQFELALLRFDAKRMPDLKQDEAGSMDMADEPTPRRAGLTAHIRASLAPGHAWRACVLRAAQRLCLVPMPESVDTAPRRPAAEAPTNAERALRARNADAQRSLASVRVGRSVASQLRTRRSARVSARQCTSPDLDMFSLVFQASSDKCPPRALHCEFASEIALPMVALRSGHLLDDHASPCHSLEHLRASVSMSRARPVRADAVLAPTSSPVTSRQTRLRSAAQPALAAPCSAASTNAATPQQPASALVAPPVALAEDRCYRCGRRFAAQIDCANAHALPWLRIWHVLVTCKRVLPPHLCHLGGSHSTARDVALTLFMHGMLSLLLHFAPDAADFTPPAPDASLHDALLSLRVHSVVGGVASTLLEVLHANATRRSPRASTVRGFLALLLLPSASDLPLVGARVMTVLVAHLVTCRQVDLRAAATPSGLRTMMRRHAGTAAQDLDVLALAGIGARHAAGVPDTPLSALPCAPLGSSQADDMATSDVDSECELTDACPLSRSSTVPDGCAPLVRILRAVPCPLDGSMTAAALLTALRGVARLGRLYIPHPLRHGTSS